MSSQSTFDITAFIDARKMNRFNFKVLAFCFLVVMFDGYDVGSVAFAGPSLIREWGIHSMAALGTAFSAGLFGILFGAIFFGWIGDRFGRKRAIITALLVMGAFSLASAAVGSLPELIVLRFATGLGLGGLLPNPIALNAEFSPRRVRATMIIIGFSGINLGAALPGLVAVWLVPTYGWQILFLIGGLAPMLLAAAAYAWMPESIKYLALKTDCRARMMKTLHALDAGLRFAEDTVFVVSAEKNYRRFRPRELFDNGLHFITPLLWVLFVCTLMSFFFVNSWLPTVLVSAHFKVSYAAIATSVFEVAGMIGGLVLCRPIDKFGFIPLTIVYALALMVTPMIGVAAGAPSLLMVTVFASGFALFSLQFGINAIAGLIYPTSIRANGLGWAFGIGRFGAVAGPMIGGFLLSAHLDVAHLFLFLAVPLSIALVASVALAVLYYRRFHGSSLARREPLAVTPAR